MKFDVWNFMKICLENKTLITIEQRCRALYIKNLIVFNIAVDVKSPLKLSLRLKCIRLLG